MAEGALDAVIFDWGGTLTPWHTVDLREQWFAYAHAYDPVHADELAGRLLEQESASLAAGREHQRSATLDEVFRNTGIEPVGERHAAALAAYLDSWTPHTWIDADAPELLRGLRTRGLKVGVLSNTLWPRAHHQHVFKRDGVLDLIDGAVYSSELPWTKPHPDAFRAAMAAVGVGVEDASRCVFVGDRPFDDIHGAKAVGMKAVLVPHSDIPVDQQGHIEGEPDAIVQSLGDVLDVVDAWR
ncbi:MAG: HAD family hydrolase [Candidatus Nanopelagicales bacterium]